MGKLWTGAFRGWYENNSLSTVDKMKALIKSLVQIENNITVKFLYMKRSNTNGGEFRK